MANSAADPCGAGVEPDGRRRCRLEIPADSPFFAGHFPGAPIFPGIAHPALVTAALASAGEISPTWISEIVSLKLRSPVRPGDALDLFAGGPEVDGLVRFEIRREGVEGSAVSSGMLRFAPAGSADILVPAAAPEETAGFPAVPSLVPHQLPARLVRGIVEVGAESFAGIAEIPPESPFVRDRRAPSYLALEAAAQGAAVLEALGRRRRSGAQTGYLVGIRNARCRGAWLPAGVPFPVAVRLTGSAPPLAVYSVSVAAADGGELVAGTIQTYLAA